MTINKTLILITASPSHPLAQHAYRYVSVLLKLLTNDDNGALDPKDPYDKLSPPVHVFFYAEAAHTANRLNWQVADRVNLMAMWQQLSLDYHLRLPVCVSTALTRGITDESNAIRHDLPATNLAEGFELVGLAELADSLDKAQKVLQF